MYQRKRGLTLCYNCRQLGHIAKYCYEVGPPCLCCKKLGHVVENCPRIIARVEEKKRQEEIAKGNIGLKLVLWDHRDTKLRALQALLRAEDVQQQVSLSDSLRQKQCISARMNDFDIDCIIRDEET